MIRNRYIGRNSSLSLFVPDPNSPALFAKYFNTGARSKNHSNNYKDNLNTKSLLIRRFPNSESSKNYNKSCSEPICDLMIDGKELIMFDNTIYIGPDLIMPNLPPLPTVFSANKAYFSLFLDKIKLICKKRCNFDFLNADLKAKTIKQNTLIEMNRVLSISSFVRQFPVKVISKLLKMILNYNIERRLKQIDPKNRNMDEIPVTDDPEMMHLSLCYQIYISLLKTLPHFKEEFNLYTLSRILKQIGSCDADERMYIQNILLTYCNMNDDEIYDVYLMLSNLLVDQMDLATSPFAYAPILNIMQNIVVSIVEIPQFFDEIFNCIVLTLFSSNFEPTFNAAISSFINVYVFRRPRQSINVINALLHYWPETRNEKQSCFLKLIVTIVPVLYPRELKSCINKIFTLFSNYSISMSQKVSLATFSCFTDPVIEPILLENSRMGFPMVYQAFLYASHNHWSATVRDAAKQTLIYMRRINPKIYKEISEQKQVLTRYVQDPLLQNWALIARSAANSDESINISSALSSISRTFASHSKNLAQANVNMTARRGSATVAGALVIKNARIHLPCGTPR